MQESPRKGGGRKRNMSKHSVRVRGREEEKEQQQTNNKLKNNNDEGVCKECIKDEQAPGNDRMVEKKGGAWFKKLPSGPNSTRTKIFSTLFCE